MDTDHCVHAAQMQAETTAVPATCGTRPRLRLHPGAVPVLTQCMGSSTLTIQQRPPRPRSVPPPAPEDPAAHDSPWSPIWTCLLVSSVSAPFAAAAQAGDTHRSCALPPSPAFPQSLLFPQGHWQELARVLGSRGQRVHGLPSAKPLWVTAMGPHGPSGKGQCHVHQAPTLGHPRGTGCPALGCGAGQRPGSPCRLGFLSAQGAGGRGSG